MSLPAWFGRSLPIGLAVFSAACGAAHRPAPATAPRPAAAAREMTVATPPSEVPDAGSVDAAQPVEAAPLVPSPRSISIHADNGHGDRAMEVDAAGLVLCTADRPDCHPSRALRYPERYWAALEPALRAAIPALDGSTYGAHGADGFHYSVRAIDDSGSVHSAVVADWDAAPASVRALIQQVSTALRASGFVIPPLTLANIESVTIAIDGEEGEHADVTVDRTGRIRHGASRRGHGGGGAPVMRTSRARVASPEVFFAELVRRLDLTDFREPVPSGSHLEGYETTLTVTWEHTEITRRFDTLIGPIGAFVSQAIGLTGHP